MSNEDKNLQRASRLDTTSISDALDRLGIAGQCAMTTIVVGDFNDWFWPGSVRSALSRELPAYTRYRTFPSRWPLLRLDRVYCRPGAALIRSYLDLDARTCSDHLAIVADVAPSFCASSAMNGR